MEDECIAELGRPITGLKVAELRDELTKRSLVRTGNKKELVDRLRTAIQRETLLSAANQTNISSNQQQPQPPQIQQNVHQVINPAVGLNQDQVAAVYQQQLNQLQSQAHSKAFDVNPQQQYHHQEPETIMQPLDLQQQQLQITDRHAQDQNDMSADQQLEQQKLLEERQQYQADETTTTEPPPLDMRVPQEQSQKSSSPETQSIDLSNSARQQSPQRKSSDEISHVQNISSGNQSSENLTEPHDSQESVAEQQVCQIDAKDSLDCQKDLTKPEDHQKDTMDAQDCQKDLTEPIDSQKVVTKPENSQMEVTNPQDCQINVANQQDLQKNVTESQNSCTISLKRSASSLKGAPNASVGKEKRRKWSSSVKSDDSQASFRATVITGGISSQRLQELIEEKPAEANSTSKPDIQPSGAAHQDSIDNNNGDDQPESTSQIDESLNDSKCTDVAEKEKSVEEDSSIPDEVRVDTETSQAVEPECEPTNILLVQNLVRPFTLVQLKDVLTKQGSIIEDKFWIDKVKSKCCAMYESIEVAQLTKEALHGQQWPASNPKTLKLSYITEETLIRYQNSDNKIESNSVVTEMNENGDLASSTADQSASKSMANRLGERVDDVDGSADQVKRRLGDKVPLEISTMSSNVNRDGDNSNSQELDDLFKKTKAIPHLFWLPLTEDQAVVREKERAERISRRESARKNQGHSPMRRRSPPIRHRSPIGRRTPPRRRSPPRQRSPISRRSPPGRRLSPRYRSPLLRRPSPVRRRSPRPSPPPRRRSPSMTPPPQRRRSPSITPPPPRRRSPGLNRRSPGPIRRSPMDRSPGFGGRRSPAGPMRRSPGLIRRSPGLIRRSPQLIRRSPAPVRGSSPHRSPLLRKRSPLRRRSPPRHISPSRAEPGYPSDQRRLQRVDRRR